MNLTNVTQTTGDKKCTPMFPAFSAWSCTNAHCIENSIVVWARVVAVVGGCCEQTRHTVLWRQLWCQSKCHVPQLTPISTLQRNSFNSILRNSRQFRYNIFHLK